MVPLSIMLRLAASRVCKAADFSCAAIEKELSRIARVGKPFRTGFATNIIGNLAVEYRNITYYGVLECV